MRGTLPLGSSRLESACLLLGMLLHLSSMSLLGAVKALLHTRPVLVTAEQLPLWCGGTILQHTAMGGASSTAFSWSLLGPAPVAKHITTG